MLSPSTSLSERWPIVLSGGPPAHLTWLGDGSGRKAVLKLPRDRSDRKLIEPFNEVVCTDLADVLDLSSAETSIEFVGGEPAILSVVKSELNFTHVESTKMTLSSANLQFMATLFVADWWMANTDRGPGKREHVIVVQTEGDVALCPIDYSHALNGCSGEVFTLQNVTDQSKTPSSSYQHISEPYIRSFSDLQPAINRVGSIGDSTIVDVIETTSTAVTTGRPPGEVAVLKANAEVVTALLKLRRDSIVPAMTEWCRAKGRLMS